MKDYKQKTCVCMQSLPRTGILTIPPDIGSAMNILLPSIPEKYFFYASYLFIENLFWIFWYNC